MLTLALTLLSTQGVLQPTTHSLGGADDSRPVYGARLTQRHANAIGEGMLLAQADLGPPPIPPAAGEPIAPGRSLQDLRAEYQRLEESRPGLAGSIVMLSIGVVALAVGIPVFFYVGVWSLLNSFSSYLWLIGMPIGIILIALGITFTIVGAVGLGRKARERRTIGDQMEEIKRQIEALESAPPPPPPPSSVERLGPAPLPGALVMSF